MCVRSGTRNFSPQIAFQAFEVFIGVSESSFAVSWKMYSMLGTRSRIWTASAALSLPPERLRMWRTREVSSGQSDLKQIRAYLFYDSSTSIVDVQLRPNGTKRGSQAMPPVLGKDLLYLTFDGANLLSSIPSQLIEVSYFISVAFRQCNAEGVTVQPLRCSDAGQLCAFETASRDFQLVMKFRLIRIQPALT